MKNIKKNKMKLVIAILFCGMLFGVSLFSVAKPPGPPPDPGLIPNDDDWDTWTDVDFGNMYAIPEGNVGIGITDGLQAKLHVDTAGGVAIYGRSESNDGIRGLTLQDGYAGVYGFCATPGSLGLLGLNNAGGIAIMGQSTGWAGYFTGNLYASGNVGIGTTTPNAKLDVKGDTTDIIIGENIGSIGNGIKGISAGTAGAGVMGIGNTVDSWGVYGGNPYEGTAILGQSNGIAVYGDSITGTAIKGVSGGLAGEFIGDVQINGVLDANGVISMPLIKITEDYTISQSDYTIIADPTSEEFDIILPPADEIPGRIIIIKRVGLPISSGGNYVHVYPDDYGEPDQDLFDGIYLSFSIGSQYTYILQCDGINSWYLISNSPGF